MYAIIKVCLDINEGSFVVESLKDCVRILISILCVSFKYLFSAFKISIMNGDFLELNFPQLKIPKHHNNKKSLWASI